MADLRHPIGKFTPPAEYTSEFRSGAIAEVALAPARIEAAVKGLTSEQMLTSYRDGGWTVAQVVHHLADSHANAYMRFKLGLTETDPAIRPYDENAWASLPDGMDADVAVSLQIFSALQSRMHSMLTRMTPAEFGRSIFHPEHNRAMSLDRLLAIYSWHGRHHAAHITALRERMGWRS